MDLIYTNGLTPLVVKEIQTLQDSSLNMGHFSLMLVNEEPFVAIYITQIHKLCYDIPHEKLLKNGMMGIQRGTFWFIFFIT